MRFVAIDLANLPAPTAVVPPVVTNIISAIKQAILDAIDDPVAKAEVQAVMTLESDPITKLVEARAYRELLVYQRINEAVQAVLLASSQGTDLDQLTARLDVQRLVIAPATDTTAAVMESDPDLRYRYQLAPEAFSVAGPYGAYEFLAREAHPLVKDAAVYGPESGLVTPGQALTVLISREGDGTPSLDILNAVFARISHEDAVPDTDEVLVRGATIVPYSIRYLLQLRPGADATLIVAQALARLTAYADADNAYAAAVTAGYTGTAADFANLSPDVGGATTRRVGGIVALSALDGAAHQDRVNVVRAVRLSPLAEINPALDGAAYCTSVVVEYEVIQ